MIRCQVFMCEDIASTERSIGDRRFWLCAHHATPAGIAWISRGVHASVRSEEVLYTGMTGQRLYDNSIALWRYWRR